jgi:hypothetical protein
VDPPPRSGIPASLCENIPPLSSPQHIISAGREIGLLFSESIFKHHGILQIFLMLLSINISYDFPSNLKDENNLRKMSEIEISSSISVLLFQVN